MKDLKLIPQKKSSLLNISMPAENVWTFLFSNNISVNLECPWRLTDSDSIILTNLDHGQIFGFKEKIDCVDELKNFLKNTTLKSIVISPKIADINILFENNLSLECFANSSGYESWGINFNDKKYICVGGGELNIY